jgi:hypothetical protein
MARTIAELPCGTRLTDYISEGQPTGRSSWAHDGMLNKWVVYFLPLPLGERAG